MSGQRAVVIGAKGGIGRALAERLRAQGAIVHALSRYPDNPADALDLRDEDSIADAARIIGNHGPVDLVIVATGLLHAGPGTPEKAWRDLSGENLADYFAINAIGPALVAKHFLPLLPRNRRSAFAALSARVGSISDNQLGGWYGYRASKAALNMFVKTLAIELARKRPEAVCVAMHPGTVDTRLSAPFQSGVPAERLFAPTFAAERILEVLDGLDATASGGIYAWDGSPITP